MVGAAATARDGDEDVGGRGRGEQGVCVRVERWWKKRGRGWGRALSLVYARGKGGLVNKQRCELAQTGVELGGSSRPKLPPSNARKPNSLPRPSLTGANAACCVPDTDRP